MLFVASAGLLVVVVEVVVAVFSCCFFYISNKIKLAQFRAIISIEHIYLILCIFCFVLLLYNPRTARLCMTATYVHMYVCTYDKEWYDGL